MIFETSGAGKSRFRAILGGSWEVVGGYGAIWRQLLPKLGPRCAQDGRSWPQGARQMGHDSAKLSHEDAKMGHDSAKIAIFSSACEVLGCFWEHSGTILPHELDCNKKMMKK